MSAKLSLAKRAYSLLFNSALRIRGQAHAMCWVCYGVGGELALLAVLPARGLMHTDAMHALVDTAEMATCDTDSWF
jgi:hypothetical protein